MKLLSILVLAALLFSPFARSADVTAVSVKYVIGKGKDAFALPQFACPLYTEHVTRAATREIPFPTKWKLPFPKKIENNQIITPLTPTAFETAHVGWTVRWNAEMEGDIILLTSLVEFVETTSAKGVYGQQSGPVYSEGKPKILLTENVAKTMVTSRTVTPFQINALPGKTYQIKVKRLDKWVPVSVTCEAIKG